MTLNSAGVEAALDCCEGSTQQGGHPAGANLEVEFSRGRGSARLLLTTWWAIRRNIPLLVARWSQAQPAAFKETVQVAPPGAGAPAAAAAAAAVAAPQPASTSVAQAAWCR